MVWKLGVAVQHTGVRMWTGRPIHTARQISSFLYILSQASSYLILGCVHLGRFRKVHISSSLSRAPTLLNFLAELKYH